MVKLGPALATGGAVLTVTVTKSVLLQPFVGFVATKVYGVVTVGVAKGAAILFAESPVAGVQV